MITFFLIMVLAVFMLHTGLAVLLGYSTLHSEKREKYGYADLMIYSLLKSEDKEKIEEVISNTEDIVSYEKCFPMMKTFEQTKAGSDEESKNAYDTSSMSLIVLPYEEWGEIEKPHFVELSEEEYENPIYISLFVNTNLLKAELGDSVDMKVDDKYYTFQVAGIYESLISSEAGVTYVSPSLYNEWKTDKNNEQMEAAAAKNAEEGIEEEPEEPLYTMTIFYMKAAEGTDQKELTGELTKELSEKDITAVTLNSDNVINDFTYMQNMIAAMLSAFALIITAISMIIIYFRVSNSIEQNITNIGALKALGYTSRQIRLSMVIEFALTTTFAVLAGIAASYGVLPVFENMIRGFSGAVWDISFDAVSFAITFVVIVGTVVLVSFSSTKMIKKLDPVIALRFGVESSNFKKNRAPIEKTAGPLTWIMALKSVLTSTKQNIILVAVSLSIGIVTTFAAFLSYNCVYDATHLYRMLQLVGPDVDLYFTKDEMPIPELMELSEVDAAFWMDYVEVTAEGNSVSAYVTEDWSDIPEVNIYEGRLPIYDNELAIGGNLGDSMGLGVGDEIKLTYGHEDREYLVTGVVQGTNNYGNLVAMTSEGIDHLGYKPDKSSVSVFVKGHSLENTVQLVKDVQDMYGDKLTSYGNVVETINNGEQQVVAIAAAMVFAMVIVSITVIILSLNLLVKTMIIKKQKEIGIKKAIGFSSDQLRTELVLSMLPQIGIGATVGAVIGCMVSNDMIASLLATMGVMRSNMEIFPWMGIASVALIMVVSFFIIWIISGKIKHISAYSLITE